MGRGWHLCPGYMYLCVQTVYMGVLGNGTCVGERKKKRTVARGWSCWLWEEGRSKQMDELDRQLCRATLSSFKRRIRA